MEGERLREKLQDISTTNAGLVRLGKGAVKAPPKPSATPSQSAAFSGKLRA